MADHYLQAEQNLSRKTTDMSRQPNIGPPADPRALPQQLDRLDPGTVPHKAIICQLRASKLDIERWGL